MSTFIEVSFEIKVVVGYSKHNDRIEITNALILRDESPFYPLDILPTLDDGDLCRLEAELESELSRIAEISQSRKEALAEDAAEARREMAREFQREELASREAQRGNRSC